MSNETPSTAVEDNAAMLELKTMVTNYKFYYDKVIADPSNTTLKWKANDTGLRLSNSDFIQSDIVDDLTIELANERVSYYYTGITYCVMDAVIERSDCDVAESIKIIAMSRCNNDVNIKKMVKKPGFTRVSVEEPTPAYIKEKHPDAPDVRIVQRYIPTTVYVREMVKTFDGFCKAEGKRLAKERADEVLEMYAAGSSLVGPVTLIYNGNIISGIGMLSISEVLIDTLTDTLLFLAKLFNDPDYECDCDDCNKCDEDPNSVKE